MVLGSGLPIPPDGLWYIIYFNILIRYLTPKPLTPKLFFGA